MTDSPMPGRRIMLGRGALGLAALTAGVAAVEVAHPAFAAAATEIGSGVTDWINVVKDKGARPVTQPPYSSLTDCTTAIQNALNASVPGQVIYLPAGVYLISAPLTFPAWPCSLRGSMGAMQGAAGSPGYNSASASGSVLVVSSSFSGSAAIVIGTAGRQEVRSLWIDGNSNTTGSNPVGGSTPPGIHGIYSSATSASNGGHTLNEVGINNMSGWGVYFPNAGPLGLYADTMIIQRCGYGGFHSNQADVLLRNVHAQYNDASVSPITAPAVPASGSAYPNNFGLPALVTLSGGNVTGVQFTEPGSPPHTFTASPVAPNTYLLPPAYQITLTYPAVPTWTWTAAQNGIDIHSSDVRLIGCRADWSAGHGFAVSPFNGGSSVGIGVALIGCATEGNATEGCYVSGGGDATYGPVQLVGCQFTADSSQYPGSYPAVRAVGRVTLSMTDCNVSGTDNSYALQTDMNQVSNGGVPDLVAARGGVWQGATGLVNDNAPATLTYIDPSVFGVWGGNLINGTSGVTRYVAARPAPYVNDDAAGLYGYSAWSFDQAMAAADNGLSLAGGTIYLTQLNIVQPVTVSKIWWWVKATGASPVSGQNWAGIYSSSGALQAAVDIYSTVPLVGLQHGAFATAIELSPGSYWIALLFNAGTTPTLEALAGSNGGILNSGLSAASYRSATNGSGQASLPSSLTPSGNANQGQLLWVATG